MSSEVRGVIRQIKFVWGVGSEQVVLAVVRLADQTATVKARTNGVITPEVGTTYVFLGKWIDHEQWGRQFHATSMAEVAPMDRLGLIRYLSQIPGIGERIADRIWERYGDESPDALRNRPEDVAAEIAGLSVDRAKEASEWLAERVRMESSTIELNGMIGKRGFPQSIVGAVLRRWGVGAPAQIRANPYMLMGFPRIGFAGADKLYLDLGGDPNGELRQRMAVWHICGDSDDTWVSSSKVARGLAEIISEVSPKAMMLLAINAGDVMKAEIDGEICLTRAVRAAQEESIAEVVTMLNSGPVQWPDMSGDTYLSDHQKAAAVLALSTPVGVLTGTPGTGKTVTLSRIIRAVAAKFGATACAVASPTGKASLRLSEELSKAGVGVKAATLHSLLGIRGGDDDDEYEEDECSRNGTARLPQFLFLEEWSMGGAELTAWAMSCVERTNTHILFVGDVEQLAPVGHGRCLADIIESGACGVGELSEIRRNSGLIVETCAAMKRGERPMLPNRMNRETGENLMLMERSSPAEIREGLLSLIDRIASRGEFDPVWQVQVITATNDSGLLSRKPLNELLQSVLNPDGIQLEGHRFRKQDKVICLKNKWFPTLDEQPLCPVRDGCVYVANGEIGEVVEVHERHAVVELQVPYRKVKVTVGVKGGGDHKLWDLGYAISCHKAQGSGWPVVVGIIDPSNGAAWVMDRSWLYTLFSRAEKACVAIGSQRTINEVASRKTQRKTLLRSLLVGVES